MARHKEIYTATWTGETIKGVNHKDVIFVLNTSKDALHDQAARMVLLHVTPTSGRQIMRHIEEMLEEAKLAEERIPV